MGAPADPALDGLALVALDGRLIGINTAIYSQSGGSVGIGFATPSNIVERMITTGTTGGRIVRPWLGVSMQRVTPDLAAGFGLSRPAGLVVKDLPLRESNFRSTQTLSGYLAAAGVQGIAGIDTRKLTRILRESGAQSGCLLAGTRPGEPLDEAAALMAARGFAGLAGMDLAQVVSVASPYAWTEGSWKLGVGHVAQAG